MMTPPSPAGFGKHPYPSESKDGFLYFFSSRPAGFGEFDIYRAAMEGDEFGQPTNLGPAVNTERGETDSCISPDGDYIVFSSKRDDGFGDGDLYVSFKLPDHTWTKARNLGATVNTEHREFCPSVSPDGKYLFFTSRRPRRPCGRAASGVLPAAAAGIPDPGGALGNAAHSCPVHP